MKKFKLMKMGTTIMFVCLSSVLMAQSGPEMPCPECSEIQYKPLPKSGNWFNPEQSGVGFNLEIQNTTILGYYYGYTEAGDSMWAMFSGKLNKVEDGDALWTISTDLVEVSGGQCINCDYQFYSDIEKIGDIELTFNRLGHATYQINEGAIQNIVPLYFGFQPVQSVFNATDGKLFVPELEGWWYQYKIVEDGSEWPKFFKDTGSFIYIHKAVEPGHGLVDLSFSMTLFYSPLESFGMGSIECHYTGDNVTTHNRCSMSYLPSGGDPINRIYYQIPWGNITENRIFGEAEDGSTVEFVRIELDECPFVFQDISECVNTATLLD